MNPIKIITPFLISFLFPFYLFSTSPEKIDSLKQNLKNSQDTTQVNLLNKIGKLYVNEDNQLAIDYSEKAFDLAKELNYKKGLSVSSNNLGVVYLYSREYDKAKQYFFESIKYDKDINNSLGEAKSLKNIGLIYQRTREIDSSIIYYTQAADIFISLDEKALYAKSIAGIGTVYANTGKFADAIENFLFALEIFKELDDKNQIAKASGIIGQLYDAIGDYPTAIEYLFESMKTFEELGNLSGLATYTGTTGNIYLHLEDYDNALEYFVKAKIIFDSLGNKNAIAASYGNIANVLQHENKYEDALENYFKALELFKELEYQKGIAAAYTNIGETYREMKEYDKALEYLLESLNIKEEIHDIENYSFSLNGIGDVYFQQGKYQLALKYLYDCLKNAKEVGSMNQIKEAYKLLFEIYSKMQNYEKAFFFQSKYIETKDSIFNEEKNKKIADLQTKFAVEKKEKEIQLQKTELAKKDAVLKQKTTERNALIAGIVLLIILVILIFNAYKHRKKTSLTLEQQKNEIESQAEELEVKNTELAKLSIVASETDNAILIASATGKIEWVNDAFTKLYGYTLEEFITTKGDNIIGASTNSKINKIIEEAIEKKTSINYVTHTPNKSGLKLWVQTTLTPIIDDAGDLIKIIAIDTDISDIKKAEKRINEQKEKIEEQNRNITDSIVYAQRIQRALLPPGDYMKQLLPQRFILYKPRDIVSGDFYWVSKKDGFVISAAADCTGHGVPGAMMSMLGVSMLNEVVNTMKKLDAGEILNTLRDKLIESLHQGGNEKHIFDGINISLCLIDLKKKNLQYAGAFSSLYLFRENQFTEIKGDKMPIGPYAIMRPFNTNQIKIQPDDMLYLFSDGFADQFGGENEKRFSQRQFRKLLTEVHDKPMSDQKESLENKLDQWKGKLEQVDDILVMGVKI